MVIQTAAEVPPPYPQDATRGVVTCEVGQLAAGNADSTFHAASFSFTAAMNSSRSIGLGKNPSGGGTSRRWLMNFS